MLSLENMSVSFFFNTNKNLFHSILFSNRSSLTKGRIQDSLTDTKTLRCHLKKLIGIDEIQCLLKAENFRWNQGQSLICGGGSGVGQMLFLADIQLDILSAGTLSDDHTGVYLFARSDKESASLLCGEKTVGYGFAGLKGNQRTGGAVSNLAPEWLIAIEDGIDDSVTLGVCHELPTVADESAGRDLELQSSVAPGDGAHVLQLTLSLLQLGDDGPGKFVRNVHISDFHWL